MRLCKTLKQYLCLIFLIQLIQTCCADENLHPTLNEYSQKVASIDPLARKSDLIGDSDSQQEDEHTDDSIEARLRTKHDLRNSIHEHSAEEDVDKQESEEDYINRLNAAFENQDQAPESTPSIPVVDIFTKNISSETETKVDINPPSAAQNDTSLPSASTSLPVKNEHLPQLGASTRGATIDIDRRKLSQPTNQQPESGADATVPLPVSEKNDSEPSKVNVIETDIVKEMPSTQTPESTSTKQSNSVQNPDGIDSEMANAKQPSSSKDTISNQPALSKDTISNQPVPSKETVLDQTASSKDTMPNQPAPSKEKVLDQAASSKDTISNQSAPSKDTVLNQPPETKTKIQESSSTTATPAQPTSLHDEKAQPSTETISKVYESTTQKPANMQQDSPDEKEIVQQEIPKVEPLPKILENVKPVEVPREPAAKQEPPTTVRNAPPQGNAPRILRSATTRMHQKPHLRNRHASPTDAHNKQSSETTSTEKKLDESIPTSTVAPMAKAENESVAPPSTEPIERSGESLSKSSTNQETISEAISTPAPEIAQTPEPANLASTTPEPISIETTTPVDKFEGTLRSADDELSKDNQNSSSVPVSNSVDTSSSTPAPSISNSSTSTSDDVETVISSNTISSTVATLIDSTNVTSSGNETNVTTKSVTESNPTSDDVSDLPRQVHVHDASTFRYEQNEVEKEKDSAEIETNTLTSTPTTVDHSPHIPRIAENDDLIETLTTIAPKSTIDDQMTDTSESKIDETHHSVSNQSTIASSNALTNSSEKMIDRTREVCWSLPRSVQPSLTVIENRILTWTNTYLPDYVQTVWFSQVADPESTINAIWFVLSCIPCLIFSLMFLSMGTKRLKQNNDTKEIRARCQQLQQYNNEIELERATFERQNQKLSDEIDSLRNQPVRDSDEELFELRETCQRLQADLNILRTDRVAMQQELDEKTLLIQRYEFDTKKHIEAIDQLNQKIVQQKHELDEERVAATRLKSNDLSLERFEKLHETIQELKAEITNLKQEKFAQTDQIQQIQEQANQLDVENNKLTIKMRQLKELVEQRDETIARLREKIAEDEDDETTEFSEATNDTNRELLSTIDTDVEKANQHLRQLHAEIDEKTRRVKELDALLNQEKERCREMETKLKVVLELRERDAHLHIRQMGQTDAELRKARNDTERVRILQQQLELKQKQLDDTQKVMAAEQTKFSEECTKLQHETHDKWMEVKRLTRELETSRKECEGLRRQITKYGHAERSSQEKQMLKPLAQHLNSTGRVSSEPDTNGSSPPPATSGSYPPGDNFQPINRQRDDSGATSPTEAFRIRPPMFPMARPPFFPPPYFPPPSNPFMMGPRFPMPMMGPHGMISPISHLMPNGSGGGSDANSFEIVDSTNITPNSTSYEAPINGSAISPAPEDEQPVAEKTKKPKKSLKKKNKALNSATTTSQATASPAQENV